MLTCTTLPVLNEHTKNGHALRGVGRDPYGAPACAGQGGNYGAPACAPKSTPQGVGVITR